MNLDPTLSRTDRLGSLAFGVALVSYAVLGDFDRQAAAAIVAVVGAAFAIGGIGGT